VPKIPGVNHLDAGFNVKQFKKLSESRRIRRINRIMARRRA
jgi:hypothetical protein